HLGPRPQRVRPFGRQPGQPAPAQDRTRPEEPGPDQDDLGRRLHADGRRPGSRPMTLRGIPRWPRSLGGQLVALLLIALIVAQAFTLWIFTDERRGALVDQARGSIVSRTAAIVRLLEETPEPLNERILDAVS